MYHLSPLLFFFHVLLTDARKTIAKYSKIDHRPPFTYAALIRQVHVVVIVNIFYIWHHGFRQFLNHLNSV